MADLDERIRKENLPEQRELKPEQNLEQRVEPPKTAESKLEKKVDEDKFTIGRAIKDTLKFSPWLAVNAGLAYMLGAAHAIFLTPIGLTVGRAIVNFKKKKKSTYTEMKGLAKIGVWGATMALAAYTIPDYFIKTAVTLPQKILKTLLFNPLMVAPWMAWFRTTTYIVEKYGTKKLFYSFFNFKIFKYMKEAYRNDLKKKLGPTVKETFLTLAPIHFYSLNYITKPISRLVIGTGNDILFAMIAGEEGLLKTLKEKFGRKEYSGNKPKLYNRIKDGLDNFFRYPGYKPSYGGSYK